MRSHRLLLLLVTAWAVVLPALPAGPARADLPPSEHAPSEVREEADDILDRPEFRRSEPNLFDRIQRWFSEALGRILGSLLGGGGGSVVAWLILLAAVGLVAVFAARSSRTVQLDPARHAVTSVEPVRSARDWRAEADRHEADGSWKEALRCRYRALVADLAARGVVEEVDGRTAGEYRSDVARRIPAAADEFAGATELFERAWYGDRPTGASEASHFRELAGRVLEGAGR